MSTQHEEHGGSSMLELFRAETETQVTILTAGLLELERGNASPQTFEFLMRAAHSLKGAARIVAIEPAASIAHALEDCFVEAQRVNLALTQPDMDLLLSGVDLFGQIARHPEPDGQLSARIVAFLDDTRVLLQKITPPSPGVLAPPDTHPAGGPVMGLPSKNRPAAVAGARSIVRKPAALPKSREAETVERVLRLAPENLNRLLGLASESLVDSRWLRPFADSFQQLKRHQMELGQQLEVLRDALGQEQKDHRSTDVCAQAARQLAICQKFLSERLQDLELFDRRSAHLSQRLYLEVLRTRMRPFSDAVRRFPRMVRDLAKSLNKQVSLEIAGDNTQVDRDILERLETPLAHLLRNAVDHGCETPEIRTRAGKAAEAIIRIEARHSAGVLLVTVSDDGAGVDLEQLRQAVLEKKLANPRVAARFTDSELLEFLFLPGFSLKNTVTEISGRGFGLDIVQNMVKSVRGGIRVSNQAGQGLRVQLQLPLTLSVLRALLVQVAGEPYAIPLAQISRTIKVQRSSVQSLNGRQYFTFADQQIALFSAHQIFGFKDAAINSDELPVIILGERNSRCGLIVDRFLGERELVVQPLDLRLGKIKNVTAAALMEDGAPILILDVEETIRSIDSFLAEDSSGRPVREATVLNHRIKRVLAVDDSLTVREMERQLLSNRGYVTDVAADGVEAWAAVRSGIYDLVITDLDMPRMDGLELTSRIKKDPHLGAVPVLIISYKDRPEDRLRGASAGADYYLAKGSFQDKDLLQAVIQLIGEPGSLSE